MITSFYDKQSHDKRQLYLDLLNSLARLSRLFSESNNPYLHYRIMENIFCKSFQADNLSRSDVSVDARKDKLGIGLKTFLQNRGISYQKVAEFNQASSLFKNLSDLDLVLSVAEKRNKRIIFTKNACDLDQVIYHLITRSESYMAIYEEEMSLINLENLEILKRTDTTIHFTDKINDYNFNLSKSTLFKRFDTRSPKMIQGLPVSILEDPYSFLLECREQSEKKESLLPLADHETIVDSIILPLYSYRNNEVQEKSGLNQWNAGGRKRDEDEAYILVPAWIHRVKLDFFDYNTEDFKTSAFDVCLPNGKVLSMRIAQQGGKALMSNPNVALGRWILREVLELKPKVLVTKDILDIIGIDSVRLSKMKDGSMHLDFAKTGSFAEFREKMLGEKD